MRKVHYITIAAAVALIAVLYFAVNTKPFPEKEDNTKPPMASGDGAGAMQPIAEPASVDSILTASKAKLPIHAQDEIKAKETKLASITDSTAMIPVFAELAKLWQEHKQVEMATYYYGEEAKLVNSEKKLTFAAQLFLSLMYNTSSESVKVWAGNGAIDLLQRSLIVNPDNDTMKMALASAYIDGGSGQPMQGIQLLLGITREKPDNIAANMMLGQLSVRSGQFDKAVDRFEKVLKIEPDNTEALYFLGNVYGKLGRNKEAVEMLEKCKKTVNNPQLKAEIDNLINSFK